MGEQKPGLRRWRPGVHGRGPNSLHPEHAALRVLERHLRVYLVDPRALVRGAVRQAIESGEVEVVGEAPTGEQALDECPELRPDVVLFEIELPGIGGLGLLRELGPRLPDTKFVVLTDSIRRRDVLDAIRSGASGYLTKDLAAGALRRAVQGVADGEMPMARWRVSALVRDLVDGASRTLSHDPALVGLTEREVSVLQLVAEGQMDHEIAETLMISPRTVETHVSHILRKLGVRNRAEAAKRYREGT